MRVMGTLHFWIAISPQDEDIRQFRREKVEIAIEASQKEKSAGVDNISAEFVQAGG